MNANKIYDQLRTGRARLQACKKTAAAKRPPLEAGAKVTDLLLLPLDRESRELKSPKNPAKSHVKPQNPENPRQKIRNSPKINSLQPKK
jgi:hypothetical protein